MNLSRPNLEKSFLILFVLTLAYSLWAATVGWNTPLNLQYDFVQSKAAITTYYIAKGGPILQYELPVMGPPWSIPYEFPIYQVATAIVHNLTGISLESAGRVVAKFFFYLSCIPLMVIASCLGFRGKLVLIPAILFLASPIYLFWSRQFMIESTATFFGLSYLAAAMVWAKNPSAAKLIIAILLGITAALAKSTTYATYALAVGLFLTYSTVRNRSYGKFQLAQCFFILFFPLIAGLLWVRFTDDVKNLNPFASGVHTSSALAQWYLFSGWADRLNGAFWYRLFRITIQDAIGHRTVWILSILLAFFMGRRAWVYWLCSALFLVAPILFTHAHLAHDYYANANAVFLVFALAVLIERALSSDKKWLTVAGVVLLIMVLGYEIRDFMRKGYLQQQETRIASVTFGKKLQTVVAPNDVLLMYGEDWCPFIPFYAERRAIMMLKDNFYSDKLPESLQRLAAEGKKVGAVVLCHEARADRELLSRLSLGPLLLRDTCDVYAYR